MQNESIGLSPSLTMKPAVFQTREAANERAVKVSAMIISYCQLLLIAWRMIASIKIMIDFCLLLLLLRSNKNCAGKHSCSPDLP